MAAWRLTPLQQYWRPVRQQRKLPRLSRGTGSPSSRRISRRRCGTRFFWTPKRPCHNLRRQQLQLQHIWYMPAMRRPAAACVCRDWCGWLSPCGSGSSRIYSGGRASALCRIQPRSRRRCPPCSRRGPPHIRRCSPARSRKRCPAHSCICLRPRSRRGPPHSCRRGHFSSSWRCWLAGGAKRPGCQRGMRLQCTSWTLPAPQGDSLPGLVLHHMLLLCLPTTLMYGSVRRPYIAMHS